MSPNDILANYYEMNWLFNQTFSVELFQKGAYVTLFLATLLPAIITIAIFYFLNKYPFCKWYHWAIVWIGAMLITGILSYNILSNFLAIYMVDSATYPDINGFVLNMIIANSILSLVTGFICTLIFKRAPLPQHNIPWSN
jgi:hypothetical protein